MAGEQLGPDVMVVWVWTSHAPQEDTARPEMAGAAQGRSSQPRERSDGTGEAHKDVRISTSFMDHDMDPRLWELSEFHQR